MFRWLCIQSCPFFWAYKAVRIRVKLQVIAFSNKYFSFHSRGFLKTSQCFFVFGFLCAFCLFVFLYTISQLKTILTCTHKPQASVVHAYLFKNWYFNIQSHTEAELRACLSRLLLSAAESHPSVGDILHQDSELFFCSREVTLALLLLCFQAVWMRRDC